MTGSTRRWELNLRSLLREGVLSRRMVVLLVLITFGLAAAEVVVPSPSPSMPRGIYVRALLPRGLRIGDLVVFETPTVLQASVPPWYRGQRLLKEVAGLAGTSACWDALGMTVSRPGHVVQYLVPPNPPMVSQREGCTVLAEGEMLVIGQHARSVDSRYIGPVPRTLLRFRVWPLFTKEES